MNSKVVKIEPKTYQGKVTGHTITLENGTSGYLDQVKLYKQEKKDKGEYYCYICGEEFVQSSIDLFPTIHHTKGRSGDYYLDKQFWMLAHNKCHLGVFHGWSVDELKQLPYWKEFLARLQNDYPDAYAKIMKQINKSGELF